jgi:hypothetical protein
LGSDSNQSPDAINTGAVRARINWLAATFDGENGRFLTSKDRLGAASGSKKPLKCRFLPVFTYLLGL